MANHLIPAQWPDSESEFMMPPRYAWVLARTRDAIMSRGQQPPHLSGPTMAEIINVSFAHDVAVSALADLSVLWCSRFPP